VNTLSNDALWTIVHEPLAPDVDARLSRLIHTGKTRDLSDTEQAELDALLKAYNAYVLRRSEAMLALKQRGYDVLAILKAEEGEG
jgi:hypothetical protein